MNTHDIALPELSDRKVDEIEAALFAQISQQRHDAAADAERARARSARRGRIWMGAAAAATFVAVAAIIAPQLAPLGGSDSSVSTAGQPVTMMDGAREGSLSLDDGAGAFSADGDVGSDLAAPTDTREIIATASATVRVDDARAAADAIADAAGAAGGYVESMSISGDRALAVDPYGEVAPDQMITTYPAPSGAWITVRIPADQLTTALADLSHVGEVISSQVDRRDVTTEAVDLRARVAALEASVTRLTDLMAQSSSTADLIAAESALAQRQSELDSLRQQLTWLDSQVGMSTLSVSLTEPVPVAAADPAGFGDGLTAGWSGLVATLNGVVVGIGFLLPWLAVLVVAGLVVWGVRRVVRARRAARPAASDAHETSSQR